MLICMRTTVDIDDQLLMELKRQAASTRRTLRELIEDAIRSSLAARAAAEAPGPSEPLVTFRGRGVRGGVNLDSMSELLDVMERVP